jgi:hypothetical protein
MTEDADHDEVQGGNQHVVEGDRPPGEEADRRMEAPRGVGVDRPRLGKHGREMAVGERGQEDPRGGDEVGERQIPAALRGGHPVRGEERDGRDVGEPVDHEGREGKAALERGQRERRIH